MYTRETCRLSLLFFCGFALPNVVHPYDNKVVIRSDDVVINYSIGAKILVDICTKTRLQYDNYDEEYPLGVDITCYDNDHKLIMTIKAHSAFVNHKKKLWDFCGDVEFLSISDTGEQRQINTDRLLWDQRKKIIYNEDTFVRMETDNDLITGSYVYARQDLSYYRIGNPDCYTYVTR